MKAPAVLPRQIRSSKRPGIFSLDSRASVFGVVQALLAAVRTTKQD